MSNAKDVIIGIEESKEKQPKNWKNAGRILIKVLAFLTPLFVLACMVIFNIDVMNYFLDNEIIIQKDNIFHAIAVLTLVIYFSWRPYEWVEYKMERYIREMERTQEKEGKD